MRIRSKYLEEKLTAADPTSKWISDFVHSDNPKFDGKSKKERIRMALGASYAAKGQSKNEDFVIKHKTSGQILSTHKSKDSAEDEHSALSNREEYIVTRSKTPAREFSVKEQRQLHRVNVTVTYPNHPATTMRNTKIQKIVALSADDKDHAVTKAQQYYKDRGYKVHDHLYMGLKEEVEELAELDKEPGGTLHRYLAKAGGPEGRQRRIKAAMDNPQKLKKINTGIKSAETKIGKERQKQTGMNPQYQRTPTAREIQMMDTRYTHEEYDSVPASKPLQDLHQDERKKRGLPEPDYYLKLAAQKKKEIEDMKRNEETTGPGASKKAENKFHNKLDKLVHNTFGHSSDEKKKNEEVEQIDELKKSTLASYAKKATHSARIKQKIAKDFEAGAQRARKPDLKASGEELSKKYQLKAQKREAGVNKAIDRLAKEEVESDYLLEYPEDLAKMKKADSYKVGDKVYTKVGGRWHKGHITTPLNKAGNHGVKFQHNGKTHSYVSSPNQLRLHVEELDEAKDSLLHFQQTIASILKKHPDADERNKLAKYHADAMKKSNPNFDHEGFLKAAGVMKEEVEQIDEGIHKEIAKYAMDNYSSYSKKPGRYEIHKARGYIKNPTGKKIDYDKVQQHIDTMHKQRFGEDVKEEVEGVAEAAKWRTHPDAHDYDTDGSYLPKGGIKRDPLSIRQGASKTQSEKDPRSMAGKFGSKYAKKHGVPTKQLMKNIPLETKEEVELDEAVNEKQIRKDLDAGMSYDRVIGKHANKKLSNTDEIRKVIQKHAWEKRMKKEEVELDEISQNTALNAYAKRAARAATTKDPKDREKADKTITRIGKRWTADAQRRAWNRADKLIYKEENELEESGGPVVWKKGNDHIEKYGDDKFALYVNGTKTKYYKTMDAAKSALKEETKKATGGLKDACWKGYTAVGLKKKGGKMVPNCVPVKEETTFKSFREKLNGNH